MSEKKNLIEDLKYYKGVLLLVKLHWFIFSQQARQYIQEPYADGYQPWTGPGYMLVREGDSLEFSINNIEFPTNYDIVIRYDLRVGNSHLTKF